MKTGIIIQARKGSTRLPNKMVLPFYQGKGVLELLIKKLLLEFPTKQIVLATTCNKIDDELVFIAKYYNIHVFRGGESNVLNRFIEAAKEFQFKNVIRICADNPFLDIPHIYSLIGEMEKYNFDYITYKTNNGLPTIKSHLGLFTEAVTIGALQKVNKLTDKQFYREHVTNFIYENTNIFKIKLLGLPDYMKDTENIRLTLDTKEDFELEKELYNNFHEKSTEDLIKIIKEDTIFLSSMKNQIIKNNK